MVGNEREHYKHHQDAVATIENSVDLEGHSLPRIFVQSGVLPPVKRSAVGGHDSADQLRTQ